MSRPGSNRKLLSSVLISLALLESVLGVEDQQESSGGGLTGKSKGYHEEGTREIGSFIIGQLVLGMILIVLWKSGFNLNYWRASGRLSKLKKEREVAERNATDPSLTKRYECPTNGHWTGVSGTLELGFTMSLSFESNGVFSGTSCYDGVHFDIQGVFDLSRGKLRWIETEQDGNDVSRGPFRGLICHCKWNKVVTECVASGNQFSGSMPVSVEGESCNRLSPGGPTSRVKMTMCIVPDSISPQPVFRLNQVSLGVPSVPTVTQGYVVPLSASVAGQANVASVLHFPSQTTAYPASFHGFNDIHMAV